MTKNADVTVAEIIEVARKKRALLTPETAGYLVLAAVDQVAVTPVLVDENRCGVQADGGRVTILSRRTAHPTDAERGLRHLLRKLLEVAGGRSPALSAVAAQAARGDLGLFVSEIESALIPVNRSAAARALSRLARETLRERHAPVSAEYDSASGIAVPPRYAEPPAQTDALAPRRAEFHAEDRHDDAIAPRRAEFHAEDRHDDAIARAAALPDEEPHASRMGDDTEPMPVGHAADLPAEPRESFDSIERHVELIEPSLPRFPLDSAGENSRASADSFEFHEEATTSRREVIEESASSASAPSDDVQQLLDDCMPAAPDAARALPPPTPPAPVRTPPPAPAVAEAAPAPVRVPTPRPGSVAPVAQSSSATPHPPAAVAARPSPDPAPPREPPSDPLSSSFPPASARGVDELLQDFLSSSSRTQDRVTDDLRKLAGVESVADAKPKARAAKPTPPSSDSPFPNAAGATDFYTSTPPPRGVTSLSPEITHDIPLPPRRTGTYVALTLVTLVALGGVALFRYEPGFLSGRTPSVVEEERRAAAVAASAAAANPPQLCRATVVVADVPAGAEVLVRAGVAPVDVERVPSGARLEFIALSEGYAPRRAVVPQGASWDSANGKPRFELPIQLEKSRAKTPGSDPWPSAEPGTVVGGQGAPGTVHIVTSPRGAEVWMVAGGGPEAKLEAMPCSAAMDLLVAGTQQGQPLRKRLHLDSAQLTPEPQGHSATARISAK